MKYHHFSKSDLSKVADFQKDVLDMDKKDLGSKNPHMVVEEKMKQHNPAVARAYWSWACSRFPTDWVFAGTPEIRQQAQTIQQKFA